MPAFRTGTVDTLLSERRGLQRVTVDGERAYVLTDLTGPVSVGDRVVINTTAVDLGLGTGGWHVVHWNLARDEWRQAGGGHVMKLRYTSLQADTGVAEEHDPPSITSLDGLPVVACGLHSQIAAVAAAFKDAAPGKRLVYVMTDGGALPLAISDLVESLVDAGLIDATVTTGQAFGGNREAVNLASGLLVARELEWADAVVAGIGPGVVGTGTALGHTGLDVAAIVDTAAALGGRAIVAARYSQADRRQRHQGVSHHTTSALAMAHSEPLVPTPDDRPVPDVAGLLGRHGIEVTTMRRSPGDDPAFFQWAGAAGVAAAALLP